MYGATSFSRSQSMDEYAHWSQPHSHSQVSGHALAVSPAGVQALNTAPWSVTIPAAGQSFRVPAAVPTQPQGLISSFDGPPQPPPNLLEGIPTPARVEQQKIDFARGIEDMLAQQTAMLAQRHQAVLDFLREKNDQQKRHACAAIDQQRMKAEIDLQLRYGEQMMQLGQAAQSRKLALDKQANALVMEYQARKAQEELSAQDYELHRRFFTASSQPLALPAPGTSPGANFTGVGMPPAGPGQPPDYSAFAMPPLSGSGGAGWPPTSDSGTAPASGTEPAQGQGQSVTGTGTGAGTGGADSNAALATLYLVVHSCYSLMNKDTGILGDVSDPFVVAKVGQKSEKTPTINNNLNPVWKEKNRFKFPVGPRDAMLELEVWNSNIFRNDSLGRAGVDLRALATGQWHRRRERLADGGEGEVEFDVRLEPHPGASAGAAGAPYSQLSFGPLGVDGAGVTGVAGTASSLNGLPFNN